MPLAYIFPAVCYLKLEEGPIIDKSKWKAWLVMLFGAIIMVFGAIALLINLEEHSKCSHGVQMDYCFTNSTGIREPLVF